MLSFGLMWNRVSFPVREDKRICVQEATRSCQSEMRGRQRERIVFKIQGAWRQCKGMSFVWSCTFHWRFGAIVSWMQNVDAKLQKLTREIRRKTLCLTTSKQHELSLRPTLS